MAVERLQHWAVTVKAEWQSLMQLSATAPSIAEYLIFLVAMFCVWFLPKGN